MQKYRLDTQTLIQECRDGFEVNKNKEKIQQLQLLLQLRNKQLHLISSEIINIKEESSIKILKLEETIIQLQRQLANLRLSSVKTKRSENQRAEQQITIVREQCQAILKEQQAKYLQNYRLLEQRYSYKFERMEHQKTQLSRLGKYQTETYKQAKQNKDNSSEMLIKSLQIEKSQLLLAKRELDKKMEAIWERNERMRLQYQSILNQKQQTILQLTGELEGLRLKNRLLSQKSQEEQRKYSEIKLNKQNDIQYLKLQNQKLQNENEKLNQLLQGKNQQIVEFLSHDRNISKERLAFPQNEQCQHICLIDQLERNLELKQTELREIKIRMMEWEQKIGFDEPASSRLSNIFNKAAKAQSMKDSLGRRLKGKPNKTNYK